MSEGQGGGGSWISALPADLQGNATLSRYADLPTFAKSHLELVSKLGQRQEFTPPTDDAGWDKVITAMRPKDASAYELPGDNGKTFAQLAHENGLHPKQAKNLFQKLSDMQSRSDSERKAAQEAERTKAATQFETALKGKWGDKYEAEKALMDQALKNEGMFPKDFMEILQRAGADKHPAFAAIANAFGHYEKEGRMEGMGGGGGGSSADPVAIAAERQKFFDANKAVLLDSNHLNPKWMEANKKYEELNERHAQAIASRTRSA